MLLTSDAPEKPTAINILEKLEAIKGAAQPGDLLLFFFAGHGVQVEGQRYLLTYDTRIASTAQIKATSLPATTLMQELEAVKVRHRVVMIDACRNDPTAGGQRPNLADEAFESAFTMLPAGEGGVRATFLSCSRGQSAYEWGDKGRGFFSYYIEQGLSGAASTRGKVTCTSLIDYLNEYVPQAVRENRNKDRSPLGESASNSRSPYRMRDSTFEDHPSWVREDERPAGSLLGSLISRRTIRGSQRSPH